MQAAMDREHAPHEEVRATQNRRTDTLPEGLFCREVLASARDPYHLADDLTFLYGRVNCNLRVSLRDHAATRKGLNTMRNEPAVTAIEHNLPRTQIGPAAMLNCNHIAGPNSRQHARPSNAQTRLASRARNITN